MNAFATATVSCLAFTAIVSMTMHREMNSGATIRGDVYSASPSASPTDMIVTGSIAAGNLGPMPQAGAMSAPILGTALVASNAQAASSPPGIAVTDATSKRLDMAHGTSAHSGKKAVARKAIQRKFASRAVRERYSIMVR